MARDLAGEDIKVLMLDGEHMAEQFWSTLAGERDERITTTDLHERVASRTVRRVPVLPPAQIANLPPGTVLLIRRGLGPVIGRAEMAWRRRDVRAASLLGATAAPLHVAYVVAGRAAAQAVQRIGRRLRGWQEEAPPGSAQAQPIADGHEHAAPWSAEPWAPVDVDHTSHGAAPDPGRRIGAPVDDAWRPR
jgi:hypothetical protein